MGIDHAMACILIVVLEGLPLPLDLVQALQAIIYLLISDMFQINSTYPMMGCNRVKSILREGNNLNDEASTKLKFNLHRLIICRSDAIPR